MKKMLDNRFLFIVSLSLIMLIILGIGAFYLFDNNDDTFVKSGYVINPLSSKVEKYFFEEDTGYKENLSSMVVFKDVDNNDVSILKDSFLHYNDGSLSFLKNGAILDLDSINGSEAVNFYNITSKSIISKDGKGYVIKNSADDIELKNFIGRINEDKYIIVGSLEAKIPGNEKNISGDYFEIVYSEEGVVNIENKDVKYQVTAEGTFIYASNIVIDLGNKKITRNGEDVMSITAITINGDENIEIIPEELENETNTTENGENSDENDGNGNGNSIGGNGEGQSGIGGTDETNTQIEYEENITVSLKNASIGSTNVNVTFDIYNQEEDDLFTLKVTNLDSGRTIDMVNSVVADEEIRVNLLSPNTKYLFTVVNEKDNNKYFQKIFETNDFGIKLEKSYVTSDEIGYKITVDEGTDITNAKLTLYKYNEDTKQNEVVTTSYYDSVNDEIKYVPMSIDLNSSTGNIEGVHEVIFDNLESDTIYTAVLDEFSLVSLNFKDIYNITLTSMTLKESPKFSDMTVNKDVETGTFKLSLDNVDDPDNAIESYTYLIYEVDNPDVTVIDPIVKSNASPIEIKIGDKENQLSNGTNYFYKLIIEYYDNEKYVEYILNDTINFIIGDDPYITVVTNDDMIGYDNFSATIYLTDNSCLISMPSREKCPGVSTARIYVTTVNAGITQYLFDKVVEFDVADDTIKYDLFVDGLQSGITYTIDVEAVRNDKANEGHKKILHTEKSKQNITTKTLSRFIVDWNDNISDATHLINLNTRFIADEGTGTLSPDKSAESIKKVVVKLYDGNYEENLQDKEPIATKIYTNNSEFNIKEKFYDDSYWLTSDGDFNLTLDDFKKLNEDGKYTIAIYAYYDQDEINEVRLSNSKVAYQIDTRLFKTIDDPEIFVKEITKKTSGIDSNLNNDGTIVGYKVTAHYNRQQLMDAEINPQEINFYVYDSNGTKVQFYTLDGNGKLSLGNVFNAVIDESDSCDGDYCYVNIYMRDYASEYGTVDTVMSRGNSYYIGYEIVDKSGENEFKYPSINTNKNVPATVGLYDEKNGFVETQKETPEIKMYVAKSTKNAITYRYIIDDPDNAIYREDGSDNYDFYYTIGDNDSENKLVYTTKDDGYRDVTISGLNNGDIYSIYYKKNITKTGDFYSDVVKYFDTSDSGKRLFEGYYDATDSKYNFKYEIVNNSSEDNKVLIKIFGDEIINRVISYRVTFNDLNGNEKFIEIGDWELYNCPLDEDAKCFSVDYIDLKNMKSKNDNDLNIITVTVDAVYDNGLSGFDYTVGEDKEYPYMIFQNNLIPSQEAKYISFSNDGVVSPWSSSLEISKGYYTYSILTRTISYISHYGKKSSSPIGYNLTSSGYSTQYGIVNPKMISIISMPSDKKTFSFSSITPTVSINNTTSLINGAVVNMTLTGADISDFCEESNGGKCINNSDSEFYLYIDTWMNKEDVGDFSSTVRPTLKVKINKDSPSKEIKATIDLLNNASTYYYNIYTYMNNNNVSERRQLFDTEYLNKYAEYKGETYSFTSLLSSDLYHNFKVSYKPDSEGKYNDKLMNTEINLIAYENNAAFNFDVVYAFCQFNEVSCGVQESDSNIFSSTILEKDVSVMITDTVNITEYDLEYNREYFMYIFVVFDYYDITSNKIVKKYLQINRRDSIVNLKKLDIPDFVVYREANYIDGDYVLDFTINVSDPDRVLKDGKYYVRLEDEDGNVVGDLQIMEDGVYTTLGADGDYTDNSFDALVSNKTVRIKGLKENTKYTIYVYSEAYINNYDDGYTHDKNMPISRNYEVYSSYTSGVAFGKDLVFSATEKSIIVTFRGGSNLNNGNVIDVSYTLLPWDTNTKNVATYKGTYIIGENNKRFDSDLENVRFVIEPDGMINDLGEGYTVTLSFHVKNPVTNEIEYFDSITNPEFAGKAEYTK